MRDETVRGGAGPGDEAVRESLAGSWGRILGNPRLRGPMARCMKAVYDNFFRLQYRSARAPGRVPVTPVDHPLDEVIPFEPRRVKVYLSFMGFWIRTQGFLLRRFGARAEGPVREFLDAIAGVYYRAAEVYRVNLSTTRRPACPPILRFVIIHAFDPHLMCIPSLHVMVVTRTYTLFREALRRLGAGVAGEAEAAAVRAGALEITEAVLYVKQHSVNCISAALYAVTRLDPALFPPAEAEAFAAALFVPRGGALPGASWGVREEDAARIREHIIGLYRRFLREGEASASWDAPLLAFLRG